MFALESNQGFYHGVRYGKPVWVPTIAVDSTWGFGSYKLAYAAIQELERDGMEVHAELSIVRIFDGRVVKHRV